MPARHRFPFALALALLLSAGRGQAQSVFTLAGGGTEDGRPATAVQIRPFFITARDPTDIVFVDFRNTAYRIRRIDARSGLISSIAGTGAKDYAGDGGPATKASFLSVSGIAADGAGNLFVSDSINFDFAVIRRIDAGTGLITRVVGNNQTGAPSDGLPATQASFSFIEGMTVDELSNLYFVDSGRLWRADATSRTLHLVAGNGSSSVSGDGGPATAAGLGSTSALLAGPIGDLFIAGSGRIRKVQGSTGIITTIAGTGIDAISGDGGPATAAGLAYISSMTLDASGNLYLNNGNFIRRITPSGTITTIAGNGSRVFDGDGKPGLSTAMEPGSLEIANGQLFFSDERNGRIRQIALDTNLVTTLGGNGTTSYAEENIPATQAMLVDPLGLALDGGGRLYVADDQGHRIRRVDDRGLISTFAGTGQSDSRGDSGPATAVSITNPTALTFDRQGNLFFSDFAYVRRIDSSTGIVTRIAGNGNRTYLGEGIPATLASLASPNSIAVNAAGDLFIADTVAHRIRRVGAGDGVIRVVAGTGDPEFGGDGGPALLARLQSPFGIALEPDGDLLIADSLNHRIRRISGSSGVIQTIAGNGSDTFSGDGGPATSAGIGVPNYLTVSTDGTIYFTDFLRVRRISGATGIIETVAGDGGETFEGDDGAATAASFGSTSHLVVAANGDLFVSDTEAGRVRFIPACRTLPAVVPETPSNGSSGVTLPARLGWHTVDGAFRYDVYLDTVSPPTRLAGGALTSRTLVPTNLLPATVYYWQVEATGDPFCPSLSRSRSEVRTFTTRDSCAAPGEISGSNP